MQSMLDGTVLSHASIAGAPPLPAAAPAVPVPAAPSVAVASPLPALGGELAPPAPAVVALDPAFAPELDVLPLPAPPLPL
jgi:hypothetical protein